MREGEQERHQRLARGTLMHGLVADRDPGLAGEPGRDVGLGLVEPDQEGIGPELACHPRGIVVVALLVGGRGAAGVPGGNREARERDEDEVVVVGIQPLEPGHASRVGRFRGHQHAVALPMQTHHHPGEALLGLVTQAVGNAQRGHVHPDGGLDGDAGVARPLAAHGVVTQNRVVARAAIEEVVAILLHDRGLALVHEVAAVDRIVAGSAKHQVVAAAANQHVVAERRSQAAADSREPNRRRAAARNGRPDGCEVGLRDGQPVDGKRRLGVPNQHVVASMPVHPIRPAAAQQQVAVGAAVNLVIPVTALDHVHAPAATDHVGPAVAANPVVAGATLQGVIPLAAAEDVVPILAVDDVLAI